MLAAAAALTTLGTGCTRQFFRERADKDVAGVITQKNVFPDWQVKNWYVYPDPRARFADPSRPDRPPYPPDDYAARVLAPNPQKPHKKWGAGRYDGDGYINLLTAWDAENRAADAAEAKKDDKSEEPKKDDPRKNGKTPELLPLPKSVEPTPKGEPVPKIEPIPKGEPAGPRIGTGMTRPGIPGLVPGPVGQMGPPAPGDAKDPWRAVTPNAGSAKGPTVTEHREPAGVVVAVGEIADGNRVTPVVMLMPAGQPEKDKEQAKPDKLPDVPPKPGTPPGPGVYPSPVALIATGDAAADYLKALTSNEAGFRIRMEQSLELGLINSREFQDRREDLYLAALPVTLQRFSFAAQAFLTETVIRETTGNLRAEGAGERWRIGTNTGFNKLFPTGAALLVQIANQFVIDITGDKPYTSISNLTVSLAQPFLRGGGYAVTLEPLTQAERDMVYAIRSYARFRKLFYVAIAAGGDYTNNPYGLQGLSANLGRGVGNNLTAPRAGFLPLLLQAAIIANQRKNIAALEDLLRLYQAFREGGQQSDLQVGQVEQQLLNSRSQLIGQLNPGQTTFGGGGGIRGYLDTLDNFKLQLGLPATLGLDLENTPLKPIQQQLGRFEEVYNQVRDVENAARRYDPAEPVAGFRARWRNLLTRSALVEGTAFAKNILPRWAAWEALSDDDLAKRLATLADERRKLLDRRTDRQAKGLPEPEAEMLRFTELEAEIDLGTFEQAVRVYLAQPWLKEKGALGAGIQAAAFRDVFNTFYQLVLEGRNERLVQIRGKWPKLPPLDVNGMNLLDVPLDEAYTDSIQTALSHRLDLMNARAQVVDAWRRITVQANSLQGTFNVQYNLNSATPPGVADPLSFSGARTRSQVIVQGELPLVRRAERNNYRAALISYQRQRRTLQAFEDNIATDVRGDVRDLRTLNELYKIQQRLIELGYSQVDNAQAILLAPPAPGAQNDAGSAAALTNQVLQAQSGLLGSQNTLYTIWVSYITTRMQFYLDLESMQIDERGVWCNELFTSDQPNRPEPEPGRQPGDRLPPPRVVPGTER